MALSGGYHLAWAIGAGLVVIAIVLAGTLLQSERRVEKEDRVAASEAPA